MDSNQIRYRPCGPYTTYNRKFLHAPQGAMVHGGFKYFIAW